MARGFDDKLTLLWRKKKTPMTYGEFKKMYLAMQKHITERGADYAETCGFVMFLTQAGPILVEGTVIDADPE